MADQVDWSSNANEALHISFVQAGQETPVKLSTFHPKFTYPIFGEAECIFGYQGLNINLCFAAHDLLPNVAVTYDKKFKTVHDTKAQDIEETLRAWIPEVSFEPISEFDHKIQHATTAKNWRPPGTLIETYTRRARTFEIWCADLTDPAVRQLIDRIQILVSLFIEGGTPIPLDDHDWSLARWQIFFVYETLSSLPSPTASKYSLVGYCTTYRFTTYYPSVQPNPSQQKIPLTFSLPSEVLTSAESTPRANPASTTESNKAPTPFSLSNLPSRARISQFLILPSHQSHSHGTHLYKAIYNHFLRSPTIIELTVEDPNEAFDDLRDYCDYNHLLTNGTFPQIHLAASLPATLFRKKPGTRVPTAHLLNLPLLSTLRATNKIAPRQWSRLVEMHLLSRIPPHVRSTGTARLTQKARSAHADDRAWYYWRLVVKQRVYKRNRDVLAQLERVERVEKCEETVGEVVGEYERLLRRMGGRGDGGVGGVGGHGAVREEEGGELVEEREEEEVGNGVLEEVGTQKRERGKRKIVLEEGEDDDDDDDDGTPEPKRARARARARESAGG
ncbi:MAG: hypothetical protein Q9182_002946 [Xanthomendoza sp. 2 TL-2023]